MRNGLGRWTGPLGVLTCVAAIIVGVVLCCSGPHAKSFGGGLFQATGQVGAAALTATTTPAAATWGRSLEDGHALEGAIVAAADQVLESVVSLEVEVPVLDSSPGMTRPMGAPGARGEPLDPFGMFRFLTPRGGAGGELDAPRVRVAGGSGVIHSADGDIVTNHHVVEGASAIRVTLHDGRTFEGELVGADPESDLAVVRIEVSDLPAVAYTDTGTVRPGQFAIAVGMPYHLDYSVTVGHVSALGRGGLHPGSSDPFHRSGAARSSTIQNFIQTDAAINPGNSGGPLVDIDGHVMGINSIVRGGIGGGFGFAIPADLVQNVASQLIETGHVSRAWIGLVMSDLTFEKGQALGLERSRGALVEEVVQGGPAAGADVRRGDVVTAVDGVDVADANDVVYRVTGHGAGEAVELTLARGGEERSTRIVADDRDEGLSEATVSGGAAADHPPEHAARDPYGISLGVVDGDVNRALGRPLEAAGVLVQSVVPSGAAARAGLQRGDVIVDVDGEAAQDPTSVLAALQTSKRAYVALSVERGGRTRFFALRRVDE